MPSPASPAGDSSNSPPTTHPAPKGRPAHTAQDDLRAPPADESGASSELSPEDWLRRKQNGNELAAALRRLADREEFAPFKAHVYSCINSVLIDAARNPVRDRARIMHAMREFGGGLPPHIAEEAKLPEADVLRMLNLFVEEGLAYQNDRLYFLTDDPTAPPRSR